MGFRFYKSFRILPGVRLNLSKSGISTTLGIPGANINLRRGRRRTTFGLPGTGLSYIKTRSVRSTEDNRDFAIEQAPVAIEGTPPSRGFTALLVIAAVILMAIVAVAIF